MKNISMIIPSHKKILKDEIQKCRDVEAEQKIFYRLRVTIITHPEIVFEK